MGVLSFFIILIVLILAHELGHFTVAKIAKIRVDEFGIFMPPRLFSLKRGETVYSINALPLGGFVRLAGEEDPKVVGSLASKSVIVRLLTLGAGSIMNLLLPFVLLSIAFMVPHPVDLVGDVLVEEVQIASPAQEAGIVPGDILLTAGGQELGNVQDYQDVIQENLDEEIVVGVRHADGTTVTVTLVPRRNPPAGQGATGVLVSTSNPTILNESEPFWVAIPHGIVRYGEVLVLFKDGIVATFSGVVPFEVAGPVGIAQATSEVAQLGFSPLLQFAAVISLNLGLVNILPLPALDGGRIVFVLIEWVRRGKRVSPQTERLVHTIGMILLMLLLVLATYRDILRILSGGGITP